MNVSTLPTQQDQKVINVNISTHQHSQPSCLRNTKSPVWHDAMLLNIGLCTSFFCSCHRPFDMSWCIAGVYFHIIVCSPRALRRKMHCSHKVKLIENLFSTCSYPKMFYTCLIFFWIRVSKVTSAVRQNQGFKRYSQFCIMSCVLR